MRNRAKIAIFPARGTQGCRAGLRAWALAILVATWTGAADAARADTFVLKSGEPIEGSIVQATRNTLIIRRAIGGMHQMSIRDIEEVRIDLAQGEQISGQMLSWADGVYQIRSGGEVIRIGEGRILSRAPLEAEPSRTPPPRPREARTVETAAAPAAPPPGGSAQRDCRQWRPSVPTMAARAETAAAREAQKATARPWRSRHRSTLPRRAPPAWSSDIELSRPAEQTIVLIYGTVDGTARAGTDYEPQQGVITLAPGTRSTQVRVPLIDHQRPRDDARFELFLTADPKVVQVVDQRITATIPGEH